MRVPATFPPSPRGIKGRTAELATLVRMIGATHPTRLALVGAGGSGKSMLACAVGHRLVSRFEGRLHWFRVGAWDFRTLAEMFALHFGASRARGALVPNLRRLLAHGGPRLVVLDNHEDDRATARLFHELSGTPVTFLITARRCLLAGVLIYPIAAPLVASGRSAFPRVAGLTRTLRWNPLALDIADSIVASGGANVTELASFLKAQRATHVHPIDHEDDLPEVALLVAWAWSRLGRDSRRMLGVLSNIEGDHVDLDSLAALARVGARAGRALAPLQRWHLVQEPMRGRYSVHAVVRHAVARRTSLAPARAFAHYVAMLERHPARLVLEQTHLFAAMDYAHRSGNLGAMLRIEGLLRQVDSAV